MIFYMFILFYLIFAYFTLFSLIYYFILNIISPTKKKKPIIIAIDGNIGSGKSTFLRLLKKHLSHKVYFAKEPVQEWQLLKDSQGNDILQNFYQDKSRWAYTFQNLAFITRINEINKAIASGKKYIITERSVLTDYNIFAKTLLQQGDMSYMEGQIYQHWFHTYSHKVHIQVYIDTDVQHCLQRVRKRGREGEEGLDLQYLQLIHDKHQQWLANRNDVITLPGNKDFLNDINIQTQFLHKIFTLLQ